MRQAVLGMLLLAACSTPTPKSGTGDAGATRDAGEPVDAGPARPDGGHFRPDGGHGGPRPDAGVFDAGEAHECSSDSDCGSVPCSAATCGACNFCDIQQVCTIVQLGACSSDGGLFDPNVTVFDASGPPDLQGQLIDECCAFDAGTVLAEGFAISPDGTRALAGAENAAFSEQLFLGPTGHPGMMTQATPANSWGIGIATFPAFSPDSTRLAGAFDDLTDSAGNTFASLWLADADGAGGTFIDQYVDAVYTGGQCILYDSTKDNINNIEGRSLHVASWTATSAGAQLESYDEQPAPTFSPGGDYVAWIGGNGDFKSLACSNPSSVKTLGTGAASPVWSPDGQRILYVALSPVDAGFTQGTVTLSSWDGTNAQTFGQVDQQGATAWSPDGTTITYQTGSGDAHVLHVRVLASGAEWTSPAMVQIENPTFTADSSHVTWAAADPDTGRYTALYGIAVGAAAGTAPVQYGVSGPVAWDVTSAGGGWVAAVFLQSSGVDGGYTGQSTLTVWPIASGAGTTITDYAGPEVVAFSPDGQYLAFGSWSDDPTQGDIQRAAIVARSGSTWKTTGLVAISPAFNFTDGFTAAWGQNDWLLVQSTTFGPAEPLYLFKADATDLGQLASLAAPEWYVVPGAASALYATSAGIWRVSF